MHDGRLNHLGGNALGKALFSAFFATGRTYPDALTAGSAAGSISAPVILVDGMAGGACQISTTLFGASPDAELQSMRSAMKS